MSYGVDIVQRVDESVGAVGSVDGQGFSSAIGHENTDGTADVRANAWDSASAATRDIRNGHSRTTGTSDRWRYYLSEWSA